MGQDIREMFRNQELSNREKISKGHQKRFESRLDEALPREKKNNNYGYLQIAAVLVVALGVAGFLFFGNQNETVVPENQVVETSVDQETKENVPSTNYRLSNDSPEFKKIEDYYMASLNIQLAKLDMTPRNKELIDAFMNKLETLDQEYTALNAEIENSGLNEETVEAMIANLQLRLDLLKKLKNKLEELKQSKTNSYEDSQA